MDRKFFFIVLSLACVSLAASTWVSRVAMPSVERKPFRLAMDQTYVYEYRARMVNGIPKLANQYAGLELEADLFLQPIDGKQVIMKLDDIKIDQLHAKLDEHYEVAADKLAHDGGKTPNRDSKKSIYDAVDANDESTIDRQLLIEYTKELSKPVKFYYTNGKVERFEAEASEQEWSVNMKKSILSLLQLDLVPSKIIKAPSVYRYTNAANGIGSQAQQELQLDMSSISDPVSGRRIGAQFAPESVIAAGELPIVYPVYEEALGGICETEYQVDSNENPEIEALVQAHRQKQQAPLRLWDSDKFVHIANVLNVTKTINFKNCLTDPSVSYSDWSSPATASEQSTLWGSLIEKTVQPLAGYYPVPEELKAKYSRLNAAFNEKSVAEQSSGPVERFAYVKYNISQWQQPASGEPLSLIESAFAEGKIKYRAEGDEFVSVSHQYLQLVALKKTATSSQRIEAPKQPVVYETIQSELKNPRQKYYESVMRLASGSRSQVSEVTGFGGSVSGSGSGSGYGSGVGAAGKLAAGQPEPELARSASWYSLLSHVLDNKSNPKDGVEPERMAASVVALIEALAADVLTEDLEQSKKAGDKVIQVVNLIAVMPKYKLSELYEQLARPAEKQSRQGAPLKARIERKLFLDALPLAASKQAIELVGQLIETQRCTASEAKEMVEAVPANVRYPDVETIDTLVRVSQVAASRKQRQLFASSTIACAKMIKNAYELTKTGAYKSSALSAANQLPAHLADDLSASIIASEADPRLESVPKKSSTDGAMLDKELDDEALTAYIRYFKQMLDKSSQYYEKVVYIEALAHLAVPHVLPILEPFVSGRLSLAQCLGSSVNANSAHSGTSVSAQQLARRQQWTYRNAYSRWALDQQHQQLPLGPLGQKAAIDKSQTSAWAINGNAALSSEYGAQIGVDAEECNHMRSVAIYALAHVARDHPSAVLPVVLPVFENTFEPYQVRIAAFTSALLAQADEHTLERVASQMWREPDQEVVSFVTGALATVANLTSPVFAKMSAAARSAVQSMPQQYVNDWRRSWVVGADHFNGDTKTTLATVAELVKSNVSMVPRAGYLELMRAEGATGEHTSQIVQLGFTAKGIESVLREFSEPNYEPESATSETQQAEFAIKRTGLEPDDSIMGLVLDNLFNGVDRLSEWFSDIRDAYEQKNADGDAIAAAIHAITGDSKWSAKLAQSGFETSGKLRAGAKSAGAALKEKLSSEYTRQQQQQWIYSKRSSGASTEEPKLALFAKLFDATAYYALDRKQMQQVLTWLDSYLIEMATDLAHGHSMHYVKMMMPSSMWHMSPSQIGLPVFVTRREPLVISLAVQGIKSTSGARGAPNAPIGQQINAIVHPKLMHSAVRFMFAVDCAAKQAYGVTTNKVHQVSVPLETSVEFSRPRQLVSFAVAPKAPKQVALASEIAKTFVGEVRLAHAPQQSWLGHERPIREDSPSRATPIKVRWESGKELERAGASNGLKLNLQVDLMSDDDQFDWTFDMDKRNSAKQSDQHRKSGYLGQVLHVIDSLATRPTKFQEARVTLKPEQANKEPVFRFDFDLTTKQLKQTTEQLEGDDVKRPFGRRVGAIVDESVRQQDDKLVWMRSGAQANAVRQLLAKQDKELAITQAQVQAQNAQSQLSNTIDKAYEQPEPKDKIAPIRRNVMLDKADKICISTVPVDVCPDNSVVEFVSHKTDMVAFQCFDKHTSEIAEQLYERYQDQLQQQTMVAGGTLTETASITGAMRPMPYVSSMDTHSYERQDIRQAIEIPRTCFVY